MPEDTLAKLVEARSLFRHGKLEKARVFLKQLISELGEDDVTERMVAAAKLVDVIRYITLEIPDKEKRKQYWPELQKYTRIALENYERAPAYEQQGFRNDKDIDAFRKYVVAIDQASAKKSGCFIATAAYGSRLASEVVILIRFRDETLLESKVGSYFVEIYYLIAPPLASLISRSRFLKGTGRQLLLAPPLGALRDRTK